MNTDHILEYNFKVIILYGVNMYQTTDDTLFVTDTKLKLFQS